MFTRVIKVVQKRDAPISVRRKTLGFSHLEAALYALMVGCSETFALYYAVKKGISKQDFALISSVPILLGAAANWLIPYFVSSRFLKPSLLFTVLIQILGLAGLFYSVDAANSFMWILVSLSLYWIGGMAASPLWIDWMAGWLPQDRLSRYLSRRNGFVALMTVIAYLLAAFYIHKHESFLSFQIVFGIGFFCRILSLGILYFQPNPLNQQAAMTESSDLAVIFKSKPIWLMVLFTVSFRFVANIASPFFLPYMVNELSFRLIDYAWIAAVPFFARAVFLAPWGEASRSYRPYVGLQLAMLISSVVCIVWTFTTSIPWLSVIEAFSGIAWGGFEIACILIMYNYMPRKARGIIGFHMALQHLANLVGALVGSYFLESGWSSFELMRFSAALRFLVFISFFLVGLRILEMRVKLRVYGDFFMTAISVRHQLNTLGRFIPKKRRGQVS